MAGEKVRQEEWRAVPGYEGLYEVSDFGRVRSLDREQIRNGGVSKLSGRVIRGRANRDGYVRVTLSHGTKASRRDWRVHHLVALAFLGEPPGPIGAEAGYYQVDHGNGVRDDNRAENLEWVLHRENLRRGYANGAVSKRHRTMRKRGTTYRGGRNGGSLTEADVREIRRLYATGNYSQAQLGRMFGVTQPNIGAIVNRKTWRHVE